MFGCYGGLGHIPQLTINILEGYLRLAMTWFALPVGQPGEISILQMLEILRSKEMDQNCLSCQKHGCKIAMEKHRKNTLHSKKSVPLPRVADRLNSILSDAE